MTADIAKAFNLNVQRGAFVSEVLARLRLGKSRDQVRRRDYQPERQNRLTALRSCVHVLPLPNRARRLNWVCCATGKPMDVEVTLDKSTSSTASAQLIIPALEGASLSDGQAKNGTKGVIISSVEKGSPAAQVGLHKDDVIIGVNRQPTQSIAELRKVLEAKPAVIAVNVMRGDESIYLLMR
ncbi:Periplasmic pH-dependent serine endoprotease DegQ precursor [Kluyvera cryocrescens]|uniref:Periplasmic pH-dependent serine endoprotease DegQ n=1 Tax=Kluyvera cryocrescens TaxID=580 RepID=A0A485AHY8_KLUCR|nr:Periplasmic pH-dependent serine endoprotease DegQ precursor [Kluyvera cryocrescens]